MWVDWIIRFATMVDTFEGRGKYAKVFEANPLLCR